MEDKGQLGGTEVTGLTLIHQRRPLALLLAPPRAAIPLPAMVDAISFAVSAETGTGQCQWLTAHLICGKFEALSTCHIKCSHPAARQVTPDHDCQAAAFSSRSCSSDNKNGGLHELGPMKAVQKLFPNTLH